MMDDWKAEMTKKKGEKFLNAMKRKQTELVQKMGISDVVQIMGSDVDASWVSHLAQQQMQDALNAVEGEEDTELSSLDGYRSPDQKGGRSESKLSMGALGMLLKAKKKIKNLIKTLKGFVKIKDITVDEFEKSYSMHRALKSALTQILLDIGLDTRDIRTKLDDIKEDAKGSRLTINYSIRLRGAAKDLAEAVVDSLKVTFTDKTRRKQFLNSFWEKCNSLDEEIQRNALTRQKTRRRKRRSLKRKASTRGNRRSRGNRGSRSPKKKEQELLEKVEKDDGTQDFIDDIESLLDM